MDILKDKNNQNYIKDTNPYEKFKFINNGIFSFYMKYNQLKNIYRQGWLKVEIGLEYANKCESIADHSFSVALLALTIIEKNNLKLDAFKCLKMCIIHELGEVYAGDYTPYDKITKEEKHIKEKEAILEVLKTLDKDNDYLEIWEEFEKIVKFTNEMNSVVLNMPVRPENARMVIDCMYNEPTINRKILMEKTGLKPTALKSVVNSLLEKELIVENTGYSRNQIFTFEKYINLFK